VAGLSDVVVVGDWPAYRNLTASAEVDGVRLHRCLPSHRDLERELRRLEPCWLLIGKVEEGMLERLLGRLMLAHPRVRVAMLGTGRDPQHCERWLRWGCDAYVSAAAPPDRVVSLLRVSTDYGVLLIDGELEMLRARPRQIEVAISQTQQRILLLLAEGRRNREIAESLGVSPATVAYHLRQLLDRLGVPTRQAAVARARQVGLL
jgi:DNA-binding NarL/FixJ family response regulator